MNRRIVLCTGGSHGDVHPFIALALQLKAMGLDPLVATAESYRPAIEAEELDFHRVRPDFADIGRQLRMDLPHIVQRMRTDHHSHLRDFVVPFLRETYADVTAAIADAALVVVTPTALAARFAVERRSLPHAMAVLQPIMFFSAYDPPKMAPVPFTERPRTGFGVGWNRMLLRLVKALGPAPYTGLLREIQREIGLKNSSNVIFDADLTASATLGLYSPLLGEAQPDFPPHSAVVGFSFYDREHGRPPALDPELDAFLRTGPPPLVFSLGSLAVHDPGDFYRASAEAAGRLGLRALLLATPAEAGRLASDLPPGVILRGYVPHSLVFPHAAAIIHHGGMGTAGQALRAGQPQLVVPFLFEQPDNAHRLARLGVAHTLKHDDYTAARAADEIRALLDDSSLADRAAEVGKAVAREDGAAEAARRIANLVR